MVSPKLVDVGGTEAPKKPLEAGVDQGGWFEFPFSSNEISLIGWGFERILPLDCFFFLLFFKSFRNAFFDLQINNPPTYQIWITFWGFRSEPTARWQQRKFKQSNLVIQSRCACINQLFSLWSFTPFKHYCNSLFCTRQMLVLVIWWGRWGTLAFREPNALIPHLTGLISITEPLEWLL